MAETEEWAQRACLRMAEVTMIHSVVIRATGSTAAEMTVDRVKVWDLLTGEGAWDEMGTGRVETCSSVTSAGGGRDDEVVDVICGADDLSAIIGDGIRCWASPSAPLSLRRRLDSPATAGPMDSGTDASGDQPFIHGTVCPADQRQAITLDVSSRS